MAITCCTKLGLSYASLVCTCLHSCAVNLTARGADCGTQLSCKLHSLNTAGNKQFVSCAYTERALSRHTRRPSHPPVQHLFCGNASVLYVFQTMQDQNCTTSSGVAAHLSEQVHTDQGRWQQQLRLGLYMLHLMRIPYQLHHMCMPNQHQLELTYHSFPCRIHLDLTMSSACTVRLS